jgi:hypothetical protein
MHGPIDGSSAQSIVDFFAKQIFTTHVIKGPVCHLVSRGDNIGFLKGITQPLARLLYQSRLGLGQITGATSKTNKNHEGGQKERLNLFRQIRFVLSIEQLHRIQGHNGGNGVFIYQLGIGIPAQQNTKIVKPGHTALQFDPIDQKDRDGNFIFSDVIQKDVL